MQIAFTSTLPTNAGLVAHVVSGDTLPEGLEPAVTAGAKVARFKGNEGQLFEAFVERQGKVVRLALAGAGKAAAADRAAGLEKAGAALAAKYLTSGETDIAIDLTGAGLDAAGAASVLLGLRLRSWRHDAYRTKLKDEQKITLAKATVVGAPEGTETVWAVEAALADGVEFTRNLVAEPGNKIFPVSFVEACEKAFSGTGAELTVL
ncbi:MAG: leucyl aminopeptidase, partial [Erythrobacter sp. 34-65-8]